ncbi:tagatose 6-phosphate kinase [Zhouia amylolytica]|uniref:Tagatose 6-phosphate kinase n=1 Tax=Zhouia amylolytica TaxID=376730 RepID=A0A1I6RNS4_9FLAO|nr:PfkB family carbohydrate kinase [Zhouia amylolytica]MCQ0110498.1 1-phosphofructokinase [Zhouia amylolytica]SFS66260.1 tagatose 6-phosphate kinase [Zhouia amylolytica]
MILSVCPNPSIDTYAWLDEIKAGDVNRISRLKEYPGGKATHVAMAVNELGSKTTLLGNWGGATGQWIKDQCNQLDIQTKGPDIEGSNRKCYTFRTTNTLFLNTELLEPGPLMHKNDWTGFLEVFNIEAQNADLIVASGSWPKGAPEDAYLRLVKETNKSNNKIILDCSGAQLEKALEACFFGLHINEHEAKSLCGTDNFSVILSKLSQKVNLIALTKGKQGLWLHYQGKTIHANVEIDNVISTVGSGDCLTAGIAYAVNKNMSLEDIARYGVACGAANCLNEDLGILKLEDVNALLPKVKINEIVNV